MRALRTCLWLLACVGCTEPLIATVGVTQQDDAQDSSGMDAGSDEDDAARAEDSALSEDGAMDAEAGAHPPDAARQDDADVVPDAQVDAAETGPALRCVALPDVNFAREEGDGAVTRVEAEGIIATLDTAFACAADAAVNPQSTTYELSDGGLLLKPNINYALAWPLSIMVLVTPIIGSDGGCDEGAPLGLVLAAFADGCQDFTPSVGFKAMRLPFEPSTAPLGMALQLCESPCSALTP